MAVDVALYPLDTLKTRLQSANGFFKAGGFRGVYKGLSAAAIGSAPGAALFFGAYDTCKRDLQKRNNLPPPVIHMAAALVGESFACLVRVPTEVIKQRLQTGMHASIVESVSSVMKGDGLIGFYHGFGATILREIPFSLVQFPLYEGLKTAIKLHFDREVGPHEAAVCGCMTGSFAAAVTTPLDVIKTRLMLGKDAQGKPYKGVIDTAQRVFVEGNRGPSVFFAGVVPRVFWIGIGGFVFFGAYEASTKALVDF